MFHRLTSRSWSSLTFGGLFSTVVRSAGFHNSPSAMGPRQNIPPQIFQGTHGTYVVHPQVQGIVERAVRAADEILPVIVLPEGRERNLHLTSTALHDLDDVLCSDFVTDTIVVTQTTMLVNAWVDQVAPAVTARDQISFQSTSTANITNVLQLTNSTIPVPPGPYFLRDTSLHQAWKTYPDELDAFATAFIPEDVHESENPTFRPLSLLDADGIWKLVAVPSRLYQSSFRPGSLQGKRIAIKDNYSVRGNKTTQTSPPFTATYGPESESANFAKQLVALGATIVGKTRMSAFASSEEPTDQWVDFHAPWNPRGDGYQTPAGSSNGAAAAMSGYPWLDYSIGTDTSGSIRYPAAICGVYGLRYSSGVVGLDGVYPCCRELDTVGLLTRDLASMQLLVHLSTHAHMFPANSSVKYPRTILYPTDFLPYTDDKAQAVLEEFVVALERFLGIKRTVFSISQRWDKCKPKEAGNKSIKEYLAKTGFNAFYYDGYNEFSQFREDHRTKFGSEAYVGPYMRWKWKTGSKVTAEDKETSLKEMEVYRRWFAENVLTEHPKTASDAVMIMPVSCFAPDYRDNLHSEPGPVGSFSEGYTASILRLPQLVVPVGQVPYDSMATGRKEWHPITASLIGAHGSDSMLISLVRATLEHAGWQETLKTGKEAWNVGKGPRHVLDDEIAKM